MLYWLRARLLSSQQERAQYQWLIIMKTRICIFLDSLLITTPQWIFLLSTMYTHSLFLHWDIIVKNLLEVSFLLGGRINVNLVKREMMWYFSSKSNQNYCCDLGRFKTLLICWQTCHTNLKSSGTVPGKKKKEWNSGEEEAMTEFNGSDRSILIAFACKY